VRAKASTTTPTNLVKVMPLVTGAPICTAPQQQQQHQLTQFANRSVTTSPRKPRQGT
jgi:hypothetical protein